MQSNHHANDLKKLETKLADMLTDIVRCWVLDIDENLFIMTLDSTTRHFLSTSARNELSRSAEGVVLNPEIFENVSILAARAHARKKWEAVFNEMLQINARYAALKPDAPPLISFMFLTNATYDKDRFIKNLFAVVYGNAIVATINPEYYNRVDQWKILGQPNNINFGSFVSTKGEFMDHQFEQGEWKTKFEVEYRHQFRLIDDHIDNIISARSNAFLASHNSTNVLTRYPGQTYTLGSKQVFEDMQRDLDRAKEICDILEKIKFLKENPSASIAGNGKPLAPVAVNDNFSSVSKKTDEDNEISGLTRALNMRSSYDTDDEDENMRPKSTTTSQSSSSRTSSPFLKTPTATPEINMQDNYDNITMLFHIIDHFYEDLQPESDDETTNASLSFITKLENTLFHVCDVTGNIWQPNNCAQVLTDINTIAKSYESLTQQDVDTVAASLAKNLIHAILSQNLLQGKNELLENIMSQRGLSLRPSISNSQQETTSVPTAAISPNPYDTDEENEAFSQSTTTSLQRSTTRHSNPFFRSHSEDLTDNNKNAKENIIMIFTIIEDFDDTLDLERVRNKNHDDIGLTAIDEIKEIVETACDSYGEINPRINCKQVLTDITNKAKEYADLAPNAKLSSELASLLIKAILAQDLLKGKSEKLEEVIVNRNLGLRRG